MKHLKSRKHHSKAFRKEAVELLLYRSDVGGNWRPNSMWGFPRCRAGRAIFGGNCPPSHRIRAICSPEDVRGARAPAQGNQKLKLHQEILKKAMGILSTCAGRYALIELMTRQYPIKDVCAALRVPRSSYSPGATACPARARRKMNASENARRTL